MGPASARPGHAGRRRPARGRSGLRQADEQAASGLIRAPVCAARCKKAAALVPGGLSIDSGKGWHLPPEPAVFPAVAVPVETGPGVGLASRGDMLMAAHGP